MTLADRALVRPASVLGAAVVLSAAGTSWYAARGAGVDGVGLARFLLDEGAPAYGVGLGWVLASPVVLLVALAAERRTPWPWTVVVTVHMSVLLALTVRLRHLVPGAVGAALALLVVLALASVLVAVADR